MVEFKTVYINNEKTKYLVYSDGRLQDVETKKFLKGSVRGNYRIYTLRHKNKTYLEKAHRLIARMFIDNPNNYPVVDHIDGNTLNNNVDNLRWASYSQNSLNVHKREQIDYDCEYEDDCDIWIQYRNSHFLVSQTGKIKNSLTNTLLKGSIDQYGYKYFHLKGNINKNVWIHRAVWECFGGNLIDGLIINHIDGNKLNNNISNLEQITQAANRNHCLDILHPELKHKVFQFDKYGSLIATYNSINDCARLLNLDSRHISACMRKEKLFLKGYLFCDNENGYNEIKHKIIFPEKIRQYNLDGNFIAEYSSVNEAAEKTGFSKCNIYNCLNGKYKTANGYKWKKYECSTTIM